MTDETRFSAKLRKICYNLDIMSYNDAKKKYAKIGVDTEKVIKDLAEARKAIQR